MDGCLRVRLRIFYVFSTDIDGCVPKFLINYRLIYASEVSVAECSVFGD